MSRSASCNSCASTMSPFLSDLSKVFSILVAFITWVDEFGKRHAIGGEDGDAAVRAELVEAEARALQLVKDHESIIRALADALVEHETLDAAALKAVIVPDTAVPV